MRKTRRAIIPKLMKRLKDYSACFVKKMKDSLVFAKRTLKIGRASCRERV